ncbi:MAG: DUF5004 domain-containing protein [Bacteroidetes bacterium]|nr:MAG: DUF5004 domain-containing protein [Bacteroidota bacterium]
MKAKTLTAILAILGMAVIFATTSCKKDDEETVDRAKLLTNGQWQLTSLTVDPALDFFGTPVTNIYAQMPTCVKDDLAIFNTNGTVNFDEGASKCELNDPQTTTGTWVLNTTQTILSITTDGETESWNISSLTSNAFNVQYQETLDGITYTFSGTFTKK